MTKKVLFLIYLIIQIVFIPFSIVGLFYGLFKETHYSKKYGVSFSAGQALQYRWLMHMFDTRKDSNTYQFVKKFPCESEIGLLLVMGPFLIMSKLFGYKSTFNKLVPFGEETLDKIAGNRVLVFDEVVEKHIDSVEQIVLPGAGFDLIMNKYTEDKDLKVFELDQENTLNLKMQTLNNAEIPHKWIHYIPVDYSKELWEEKLLEAGFDPSKKTLFLWQSVSLYLDDEQVEHSIKAMRDLSCAGSIIVQDFYATAFLDGSISKIAIKNMNMIAKQGEPWKFSLNMSNGYETSTKEYLKSFNLEVSRLYGFGEKIDIDPSYCIVESIIK